MVFNGELEIGNNVHMEALWFVFSKFIQSELDTVRAHSNNYCLRKSTFAAVAAWSEELFFLPESFGYEHRGIHITNKVIAMPLEEDNSFPRAKEV